MNEGQGEEGARCGGNQKEPRKKLALGWDSRVTLEDSNTQAGSRYIDSGLGGEGRADRRGEGEAHGFEGEDLAVFTQHPPGHFSHHQPQSQATWLSWKQDGIEQMVSTSQIPIKQGRDR